MSQSGVLKASLRAKVGSRDARKLRREGRIPASLQSDGGTEANVNVHIDEVAFLASRRHHVHLYDIDVDGNLQAALVRELQWDAMGDQIQHVEFKRVVRGVETEAEVELEVFGHPQSGILNQLVAHITIRTIPSKIPDSIVVKVGELNIGDHVKAGTLTLPEGVSLAVPEDLEVFVVSAPRIEVEETPEGEEPTLGEGPETPEAPESGGE
jgi:large subunit ribosomal protein L25